MKNAIFGLACLYLMYHGYKIGDLIILLLGIFLLLMILDEKRRQIMEDYRKEQEIKKDWLNRNVIKEK